MLMLRYSLLCFVIGWAHVLNAHTALSQTQVKQSTEVIEAYKVCERFERLMSENLDFDRAYEATFTGNIKRRRAIAIADGEFGDLKLDSIDDASLIKAYKLRMQIFFLLLPLAGPGEREEPLFFPPKIKEIIERKPPKDARLFNAYVAQLERDAARFRSHLNRLAARYSFAAKRVADFKSEARNARFEPPDNFKVEPRRGAFKAGVLGKNEAYYEIKGYTVARDEEQMRIVGINFFNLPF